MKYKIFILFSLMAIIFISCSTTKEVKTLTPQAASTRALPKAVIYKMNGNYAHNVPIVINRSTNKVVSYPAPSDITSNSTPIALNDGWYLDRRGGIGENTVFLSYTYDEYRNLKQAPSASELIERIIPESKVTQYEALPITLNEAIKNPSLLNQYISE